MKSFVYLLILANVVFFLWEISMRGGDDAYRELPIPSGLERILLSSEAVDSEAAELEPGEAELKSVEAEATEEEPAPEVKPPPPSNCFLLGPEPDKARAEELQMLLKTHTSEVNLEAKPGELPNGWWIVFPKAASLEAARQNRQMLQGKGVVDMWVFEKGSLQWAISLGLFSKREQAETARKQFADKSIVTEITPRLVQGEVYWLRIPWHRPQLELEEIVQLLNTQDPDSRVPAPIACP